MNRRKFLLSSSTASAYFAGASAMFMASRGAASDLQTVRVSLVEGDDATPTLYAVQAGIFRKYGLDVQVLPAPNGASALAALAGGSTDAAQTSLIPFLAARVHDIPLQIIAPLAIYTPEAPYAALLVKADSKYSNGRDLNGKTIASSSLQDLNWVATMAWIDQHGGDSSTVTSIELPASAVPTALESGRIAAATITTPRYTEAINAGTARVLGWSFEAIAKRFTMSAIVTNASFAGSHPGAITAFGRAIRDATRYTNAHHDQTLSIYAEFAKIDPKDIVGAPRAVSSPYIRAADLGPVMDAAVRYKIIDHLMDPRSLLSPTILQYGA